MIHAKIDDNGKTLSLNASGDPMRIAAEFAALACNMYAILNRASKDTGDVFKETLLFLLAGDGVAWDVCNAMDTGRGVCILAASEPPTDKK